jgi:hypothetical protein
VPISEEIDLAVLAMQAAYTDAASRLNEDETRKNVGRRHGKTLRRLVSTSTAILITADIILEVATMSLSSMYCCSFAIR